MLVAPEVEPENPKYNPRKPWFEADWGTATVPFCPNVVLNVLVQHLYMQYYQW